MYSVHILRGTVQKDEGELRWDLRLTRVPRTTEQTHTGSRPAVLPHAGCLLYHPSPALSCLWADELVVLLVSYWDRCFLHHGVTWNRLRNELERPPLLPASLSPQLVITYSLLWQFLKINRSAEESLCVLHARGANGLCVWEELCSSPLPGSEVPYLGTEGRY